MDALYQQIVLVARKTRLDDLIVRFNTIEQVRFHVEHLGQIFWTTRLNTNAIVKRS